jgi:hypothetical protein
MIEASIYISPAANIFDFKWPGLSHSTGLFLFNRLASFYTSKAAGLFRAVGPSSNGWSPLTAGWSSFGNLQRLVYNSSLKEASHWRWTGR